jgi:hypothetical protein
MANLSLSKIVIKGASRWLDAWPASGTEAIEMKTPAVMPSDLTLPLSEILVFQKILLFGRTSREIERLACAVSLKLAVDVIYCAEVRWPGPIGFRAQVCAAH